MNASKEQAPELTTKLLASVQQGDLTKSLYLILNGASVNGVDHDGYTPLHLVCRKEEEKDIRKDRGGRTGGTRAPLHLVGRRGRTGQKWATMAASLCLVLAVGEGKGYSRFLTQHSGNYETTISSSTTMYY
jgi:hypothetical protein